MRTITALLLTTILAADGAAHSTSTLRRTPVAFPTTPILDTFTGADVEPIPGWSKLETTGTPLRRVSNQAAESLSATQETFDYWNAGTFLPDQEAFVTVSVRSAFVSQLMFLAFRANSPGTSTWDGYLLQITSDNPDSNWDQWQFMRVTNGYFSVPTILVTQAVAKFPAGSKVGVQMLGSTMRAFLLTPGALNWAEVMHATDSTYAGAGYIGLGVDSTDTRFDNFGGGTYVPPREATVETDDQPLARVKIGDTRLSRVEIGDSRISTVHIGHEERG